MERKRITIPSIEEQAIKALAKDESGADFEVLLTLASLVVAGREIDPDFQKVANAIVAQAILFDRLPPKKKGRPKDPDGLHGWSVANRYFSLVDSGVRYADAVEQVAAYFHKDERHIMRIVKENKHLVGGDDPAQRKAKRKWWQLCADMHEAAISEGREPAIITMGKVFATQRARAEERDVVAELDAMIDEVLNRRIPTDTK